MNRLVTSVILFGFFQNILSCTTGNGIDNPTAGTVLQRLVGKDVSATSWDNSGYNGANGGPISQGSDLNCDFTSQCCWQNAPDAQLQWQLGTGAPETAKMNRNFKTTQVPSGNFLVVPAEAIAGASDQAKFMSCYIECTTGPVQVKMRHWATNGVTMKVCYQPLGSTDLQSCQNLPTTNPGPDSVTLPQVSSPMNIVIVASGFTAKGGSVAMIDDITVDANVCPTTTSSTTTTTLATTTATAVVCTKVECNFESNSACSYTNAASTNGIGGSNKNFATTQGQFQNKATGIPNAGEGQYYSATYLKPGDAAALVTDVKFTETRVVRFKAYKVVEGVNLQACCDHIEQCVYNTGTGTQTSDFRVWKTVSVSCPAGTQQVVFYAKNGGRNEGAVGLDNIQVLIPSGSDPNQASQTAC